MASKFIPAFVYDNLETLKGQTNTINKLSEKFSIGLKYLTCIINGSNVPSQKVYNDVAGVMNWELWQ